MRFDWQPEKAFVLLCRALGARIKGHGHGMLKHCDEILGYAEGFLSQALRNGSIRLRDYCEYLRLTDADPQHFFQQALAPLVAGKVEAEDADALEGGAGPGTPAPAPFVDPVAAFAMRARAVRTGNPYRHLALLLRTLETESQPLRPCDAAARQQLDALDAARYCDPKPVVAEAEKVCRHALATDQGALALRAAGVLASALRLCMQLDSAEVLLWDAYRQAFHHRLYTVAGDLLQRMVYVASDRGEHDLGFALAEKAALLYTRLRHRPRRGQALVDCGVMRFHSGHFQEALDLFDDALQDLPPTARSHRFTALQVGAFAHLGRGDRTRAAHGLRQAAAYLPPGPHYAGRLLWLRAALAAYSGDPAAEGLYRQAVETFGTTYPADTAVCSIELVHLLLTLGRQDEARALADEIKAFAFELPDGTVVQQAAWELIGLTTLTPRRVHRVLEGVGETSSLLAIERIGGLEAEVRRAQSAGAQRGSPLGSAAQPI